MDPTHEFLEIHQVQNPSYIADGVYVGFMPTGEIVLWTPREEGIHWMTLEPIAFKHLQRYVERITEIARQQPPTPAADVAGEIPGDS